MSEFAFIGLGAGIIPLGLIILIIVAVTGGRNEPDPDGERPAALYYAGVLFVALFTTLFAVFAVVASLLNLTVDTTAYATSGEKVSGFVSGSRTQILRYSSPEEDDRDYANAVRAAIIAAAAGGLYLYHDRRRQRYGMGSVAARVKRTYLYTSSFVAVIIALVAAVMTAYALFEVIAPGVTSVESRGVAGVHLIENAFLALAAGAIFWFHLQAAEPQPIAEVAVAPPTPPPPAHRGRRPRRRPGPRRPPSALAVHLASPLEGPAQGEFVGVFEVAPDR